ncbi:MAG: hypothetical protein HQ519_16790 [Planctomycetes bacterium]|nr:hypothetical protein [Planctomycetota bacterium]
MYCHVRAFRPIPKPPWPKSFCSQRCRGCEIETLSTLLRLTQYAADRRRAADA